MADPELHKAISKLKNSGTSVMIDDVRSIRSERDIARMLEYIHMKTSNVGGNVPYVYITPGASWSDTCFHDMMHDSSCHLNGVAYQVEGGVLASELVQTPDMFSGVSMFKIGDMGENINRALRENPVQALYFIKDQVTKALNQQSPFVRSIMLDQSESSPIVLGEHSSSVSILFSAEFAENGESLIYTFMVSVKSYDTEASTKLFEAARGSKMTFAELK